VGGEEPNLLHFTLPHSLQQFAVGHLAPHHWQAILGLVQVFPLLLLLLLLRLLLLSGGRCRSRLLGLSGAIAGAAAAACCPSSTFCCCCCYNLQQRKQFIRTSAGLCEGKRNVRTAFTAPGLALVSGRMLPQIYAVCSDQRFVAA
jgi:hypothetical protein